MAFVSTPDLAYLLGRAQLVEGRVRELVALRRAGDPAPDDPFRGLYVSEETVEQLLTADAAALHPLQSDARVDLEADADATEAAGTPLRLRRLAAAAGLTPLDVELLMIALLPDLDSRFERLYGYLNDDVTRRRASVGLALQLAGESAMTASTRARLELSRPLVSRGLIVVEEPDRPFLTRGLRVPDRVGAHLLGDDAPAAGLAGLIDEVGAYWAPVADQLGRALSAGVRLVHLRERVVGTGAAVAVAALSAASMGALTLDLTRLGSVAPGEAAALADLAIREALLLGAGLVAGPVELLAESGAEPMHRLTAAAVPVLLVGSTTWDPQWSTDSPLLADAPVLGGRERLALWERELGAHDPSLDPASLAVHLALGPGQVAKAVRAAEASARMTGGPVSADDLRRGVRAQNAAGLERLARRIVPEVEWADLVLAPTVTRGLKEVAARARHRDTVLTDWRMRRGGGRGHGVTALFAGDSGTGKTMSAEVIASDLGLDLYTVNLATVVDKYIGETEKNLERIFTEAGGVNAVLFFDEADAIFGKRSDVRDAHDRYANIESAYLLQRLETFDGLADPGDEPASQHRRRVHSTTGRHHRLPGADRGAPSLVVAALPGAPAPARERHRLRLPRRLVRLRGGQHPVRLDHRRLPGRSRGCAGRHAAPGRRRRAGVPEDGPARPGAGVRPLLLDDRLTRRCPFGQRGLRPPLHREAWRPSRTRATVGESPTRGGLVMHEHRYDERIETLRPAASRIDQAVSSHTGRAAAAGRTDALGAEEILGLQRSIGNAGVSSMLEEERSPVHDVISSGGRPLEPEVRTDMESRMGHDFSDVRVHDDSAAAASASAVNAHAYTVGSNIVFQRDTYDPGSSEGRTTLAHELTHVVQQRSGPVDGTSAPGGIKVSDPSDRFEQEARCERRPGDVRPGAGADPERQRARRAARSRGGGRGPGTLRPAARRS